MDVDEMKLIVELDDPVEIEQLLQTFLDSAKNEQTKEVFKRIKKAP